MTNGYDTQGAERSWWGFGSEQGGCLGCGPAWWVIAAVIAIIIFFWGWGWPGWGGWGGWGWRNPNRPGMSNCPPTATGTVQPGYNTPPPGPNAPGSAGSSSMSNPPKTGTGSATTSGGTGSTAPTAPPRP